MADDFVTSELAALAPRLHPTAFRTAGSGVLTFSMRLQNISFYERAKQG